MAEQNKPTVEISYGEKAKQAFVLLPKQMRKVALKVLQEHGKNFLREFTQKSLRGRPGLFRRSGTLARSFNTNVIENAGAATLIVWTPTKYAPIHEFGGEIKPVNKQWLTIPTNRVKTKAGVARETARGYPNLFFFKKDESHAFLAQSIKNKRGKSRLIVFFNLVKKVKIPKRLGLNKTWKSFAPQIVPAMDIAANKLLDSKYEKVR